MSNKFYNLTLIEVNNPIEDATSISFNVPLNLKEQFLYKPGQHLVIKFAINGEEIRRSYSLNSSPLKNEPLQITVKRVKNGLVSNFVADHLKSGDNLDVMIPQGRFYANIQEDAYKSYFLFAAGSGITPIISILKSILIAAPHCTVNLLYGNTNQDSIIFKDELDKLQVEYQNRLRIVYTLSKPRNWSTWKMWDGRKGRINPKLVEWFITNYPPIAQSTEYFICGPGAMNVSVRNTLIELGVPKELVHIEQFGNNIEELNTTIVAVENAKLLVSIHGENFNLNVPQGKTILQVLKEAKVDPPYSCESGVCATCVAKITRGRAEMRSCIALEDEEVANGMLLTCQALPLTNELEITFEK